MKHGRGFAQTVQSKYKPRVNPLNLEAAAGRCVLGVCTLYGRVQGLVVAGHFWCSYAWVSLTQTACARPRAACAPVLACVQACAGVCAFL